MRHPAQKIKRGKYMETANLCLHLVEVFLLVILVVVTFATTR